MMKIGVIVPQGWVGEYDGWDPLDAWRRTTEVAGPGGATRLRVDLAVRPLPDGPPPTDEITFESFTSLSALAAMTSRVRLGHIVICTAFRNPALTAKMISTMDTISGGRMELGIGAGWKRDEWLAYGYGFPETKERLARLGDDLEVITRMLAGDRHTHATYEGKYSSVRDAINVPKPIQQPRVPIMVGGNGPNVTWRLAARHADELNLDGMRPDGRGRGAAGHPLALRGDRPGSVDAGHLGPHLGRAPRRGRAAGRAPGGLRRDRRQPGDGPGPCLGQGRRGARSAGKRRPGCRSRARLRAAAVSSPTVASWRFDR